MRHCEMCDEWGEEVRTCASCRFQVHEECDPGWVTDQGGEFLCASCVERYRLPEPIEEIA